MSDNQNQAQDASMEDILSSIRKILSSDEGQKKPLCVPMIEPLELTEVVQCEEDFAEACAEEDLEECLEECAETLCAINDSLENATPSLMSNATLAASVATLSALKEVARKPELYMPSGNASIEEITKDLLFPLLKEWLDQNLPDLVERIVREEIQVITGAVTR
jgi:cell pole-organizing protein PopZ